MILFTYDKTTKTNLRFVRQESDELDLYTLIKNELFKFETGSFYADLNIHNEGVIYLGYTQNSDLEDVRTFGHSIGKKIVSRHMTQASIDFKLINEDSDFILAFLEGLLQSTYTFDYYLSTKKNKFDIELSLNNFMFDQLRVIELEKLVASIFKARDLVNLTPIDLYPESYANLIIDTFKDTKVSVKVYDESQIKELGMHALLAVGAGSFHQPRFVVLEYKGDDSKNEHLTFVGKGVTYDSGGLAIKPAASMASMKSDMAGSAAVVGALKAINDNHLKVNVVGLLALTENLIDAKSYKNGDVIQSMKGLTIEIGNTDAEGRLTLADAIYFAATKIKSTHIIELSTLTGACIVALGNHITGVVTKDDVLYANIHQIGKQTGEFNWRLPITKPLEKVVKGTIGDLKNSIPGGAGAITAGIFLTNFSENIPFAHLDIAGPSFGTPHLYYPDGASGVGVKTLYQLAKTLI